MTASPGPAGPGPAGPGPAGPGPAGPGPAGGSRGLHHIGYWTDDLHAAMAQATRLLGVGPFQVLEHVDLGDFRFRGEPATLDHSAAFAAWGPVLLELDQVHKVRPAALAEALNVRPGTVSHVAWTTGDLGAEREHLAAAGGGLLHAKGQIGLALAVVAPGLMVMAIILFMGAVSGAHLNPAVSLAFALRGDFPWKRVPGYIIIQLVGATLACLFLRLVFGNVEHLGATLPGPGYKDWQALLMEIVLTALLVSVILGTASAAQNVGAIAALGVGGYIALAGLWAAPVSGVSMNPARSFGPALASGDWKSYWVYLVGPVAGALIAVGFAYMLRGRGGDVISGAASSGLLDEGALAARAQLSQEIDEGKVVPPGIADTDAQPSSP